MTLLVSAQQGAFYTKNGYLELEEFLSEEECNDFFQFMQKNGGRDLWRSHPLLKEFLLSRKMAQLVLYLTGKTSLKLACDQWFSSDYFLKEPTKIKHLFSIQGIISAIFIQLQPGNVQKPSKINPLGLFPFPQKQGNALIVNADLLLNWPSFSSPIGLYAALYSLSSAIYIQNTSDPAGTALKQLGYGYGDPLKSDTHPLIISRK